MHSQSLTCHSLPLPFLSPPPLLPPLFPSLSPPPSPSPPPPPSPFPFPSPLPLLQDLSQFEALCQQLYDPSGGLSREAEKALLQFSELPNVLQQCQVILEQTQVGGAGEERSGIACQGKALVNTCSAQSRTAPSPVVCCVESVCTTGGLQHFDSSRLQVLHFMLFGRQAAAT